MAKIGDTVRFLNDVGGGVIVRVEGRTAYVRDPEDGFETPIALTECIVVPGAGEAEKIAQSDVAGKSYKFDKAEETKPLRSAESSNPYVTVALIFEPQDIRKLSQTAFDLYLVNDSSSRLLYTVAARATDESEWMLISAGEAEPNMQVFIGERAQCDLNSLAFISVQLIAFKPESGFELQAPVASETRMDLTRLAKLHCFTSTAYSSVPVLTVPIVANGKVVRPLRLEALVEEYMPVEPKPEPIVTRPQKKHQRQNEPTVVDLHIDELLDSTAGLQPADMLACQLREFDRRMAEAAKLSGSKIIFIHGKGEGVLRAALLDRLRRHWPKCEVQDASFREYGFGATQVTIRR